MKALIELRLTSLEQKGILAADCLGFRLQPFPESPDCQTTPRILDLHLHDCVSQFHQISPHSTHTCTLWWFCFSREAWQIQVLLELKRNLKSSSPFLFNEEEKWHSEIQTDLPKLPAKYCTSHTLYFVHIINNANEVGYNRENICL